MNNRKYSVTYVGAVHQPPISRADVAKLGPDAGACDALLLASVLFDGNGNPDVLFATVDGRKDGPMAADDVWKVWAFLSKWLMEQPLLTAAERTECRRAYESAHALVHPAASEKGGAT